MQSGEPTGEKELSMKDDSKDSRDDEQSDSTEEEEPEHPRKRSGQDGTLSILADSVLAAVELPS